MSHIKWSHRAADNIKRSGAVIRPTVLRRVMRDTRPPTDLRQSKARIAGMSVPPVHAAAERALHKAFTTAVARQALPRCRPDPGPSRGGHRWSKSRWAHVRYLQ